MIRRFVFFSMLCPLGCFALNFTAPCTHYSNNGDTSVIKNILDKLKTYFTDHIAEEAYLHFDKPYYAAGDTIYFKAYVTIGEKHELSALSGILNVDFINPDNDVYQSIKLQIVDGVCWGDFALPDTLTKGNYKIRAYTKWMLNAGDDAYFTQIIPIGALSTNNISESITLQPQIANKPDVQFLPEGGGLVTGLRSKMAFKAVSGNGLGINIKGEVLDNENKQVITFASTHLGMGTFDFIPEEGKTYKAKITYPGGTSDLFNLPQSNPNGIVLAVGDDPGNKALIKIAANIPYFEKNKNKGYILVIYSGGETATYTCKLNNPILLFDISKRTLHTGVASFTLFSPDGEPLSERLTFIQNNDQLKMDVKTDKVIYAKREKVNLKLNVKDNAGGPTTGQFSVSVIDEDKVPVDENKESTILTNLLLTANLKGYIEQPNYYFSNINDKTANDLDLVMLTHGYRRFEWKPLLNNGYPPPKYQPEKALEISGVAKSPNGMPLNKGTLSLFSLQGGPVLKQELGEDGAFRFSNLAFMDSSHFMLKALSEKLKNKTIISLNVDKPLLVADNPDLIADPGDINKSMPAYLENKEMQQEEMAKYASLKGTVLKEVKVKGSYLSSNIGGAGYADQVIRRGDIKTMGGSFSVVFNSRLRGVKFAGPDGAKKAYLIMTRMLSNTGETPMLIVLDGVPIDPNALFNIDSINIPDIETIEVLTSVSASSIYGMSGGAGVLVITTRRGVVDDPTVALANGVLPIWPKGFYKARAFYSPKYDHPATIADRKDLRTTIYWNPQLVTDKDGNASFNYYNADGTGDYRVVIEGLDAKGNLGRQVFRYKVE